MKRGYNDSEVFGGETGPTVEAAPHIGNTITYHALGITNPCVVAASNASECTNACATTHAATVQQSTTWNEKWSLSHQAKHATLAPNNDFIHKTTESTGKRRHSRRVSPPTPTLKYFAHTA